MGQIERFVNDNISYNNDEKGSKTAITNMESNGILFGGKIIMGNNRIHMASEYKHESHHFYSFFNRFGNYNVDNILPPYKKMAAIIVKLCLWLPNLLGLSIVVYWLTIDFEMIKVYVTGVGAIFYMGMKIYEKWLEIRDKRNDIKQFRKNKSKPPK